MEELEGGVCVCVCMDLYIICKEGIVLFINYSRVHVHWIVYMFQHMHIIHSRIHAYYYKVLYTEVLAYCIYTLL